MFVVAQRLAINVLWHAVQGEGGRAERGAPRATLFHGQRPPPIGVSAYLKRISKYAKCSPACFAMAYLYLERAAQVQNAFEFARADTVLVVRLELNLVWNGQSSRACVPLSVKHPATSPRRCS